MADEPWYLDEPPHGLREPHVAAARQSLLIAQAMNVESASQPSWPHELRNTAASLALSSGANVKAVQRMLGHANAARTLNVYSDLFDRDLDALAERMDDVASKARAQDLADVSRTSRVLTELPDRSRGMLAV